MHPRVCVSAISSYRNSLTDDLTFWDRHGIDQVGVSVAKLEAHGWDDGVARIDDAVGRGLRVGNLIGLGPFRLAEPDQWETQRARLLRSIDAATRFGAGCLVFTTGPATPLSWEDAADALEAALAPVLAVARAAKRAFAIEHTNSLRVDVGFVHSLHDVVDIARRLDTGRVPGDQRVLGGTRSRDDDRRRHRPHPARAGQRLPRRDARDPRPAGSRRR